MTEEIDLSSSQVTVGPWWALLLRGVLAVLFGIIALVLPGIALLTLVILFGAYTLGDGVMLLISAFRERRIGQPAREWLAVGGVLGILIGLVTLFVPAITAIALLYMIAAWAFLTGIVAIVTAIRLRQEIQGEWILGLTGLLSIGLGVLLALFPGPGALAVVAWIGVYAIVFGVLLAALGIKLRSREPRERVTVRTAH